MDLDQRIQALAQELQDMILGQVIALEPGDVYPWSSGYKLPVGLQLNHALRVATAKKFYGKKHIFNFEQTYQVCHWLRCLAVEHQSLIRRLHCHIELEPFAPQHITQGYAVASLKDWRMDTQNELRNATFRAFHEVAGDREVRDMTYNFPPSDDERWRSGDEF